MAQQYKGRIRLALFFLLIGTMLLNGTRSFAQMDGKQQVYMYLLIDNDYPHEDFGSLIVKDGNPDVVTLSQLGYHGEFDVQSGYISLWIGDVSYTLNNPFGYGVDVQCPDVPYDPEMLYPLGNDAISIINDPNSRIKEEIPYTICTAYRQNNSPAVFRARWVYAMAEPLALQSPSFGRRICATEGVSLRPIGENVVTGSNQFVTWSTEYEYQLTDSIWRPLYSGGSAYGTGFLPYQAIPELRNGIQRVKFRYRMKAVYPSHTYYSPYSVTTPSIEILPAAPTIADGGIHTTPSCAGSQNNGTVTIPGSAIKGGFSDIRWTLRNGTANTPCDPTTSSCGDLIQWSNGNVPAANDISLTGLAAGTYTLWMINPAADAGSCFTPYPVVIPELLPLTVTENTAQHANVSCFNANDGSITVTAAGADETASYAFTLLSGGVAVQPETTVNGKTFTWNNLGPGTFKAQVKNSTCNINLAFTNDIIITQPSPVRGALVATSPLCASPGDGNISVAATGASTYQFNLYSNGSLVQQSGATTINAYTFTDLPGGTYRAEIVNNDAPLCPKWDSTVTLSTLTPLTVKFVSKDSVSCFGGNDGRLEVTAEGGSGTYTYTLSRNNSTDITSSTGIFTGLTAGDYTVTLKNQGPACNDASSLIATIFQRSALNVQLAQTPSGCDGQTGAVIKATVTGGSGSYSYDWQQLKNGVWTSGAFWFDTDTQIDDLAAGTYRVVITDRKSPGCSIVSAESIVQAVFELQITKVTVQDAVCLADGAHISITATGGDGTYLYEWSLDSSTYYPFTAATVLTTTGNYKLRVSDSRGCMVSAPATYAVILPSAPVSFTYTLSDYNGYNISCKGNDNGFAKITATGGNGGSYRAYTYALDNGAYGTASQIDHITAGTHQLHVKDGRGCISTHQIFMTEPASTLGLRVTEKEHPGCGVDPIGHITVAPEGGTSPYKYTIDNGTWQDSPAFTGLPAGDYTLRVRDAGGCIADTIVTLTATYAPIATTADIADVKCYGDSDGVIALHVTGGDGNYTYQWNTPSLSGSTVNNIPSGDYTINITDNKGCKQEVTYTVHQPEKLELELRTTSICDGATDGRIDAIVSGGTTPYHYSLDQSSWLNAGIFNGLSEGKYQIAVQDAHGCEVSDDATVTKSNIKPDVNFLVASRRNAFDTLVIKDISLPEPGNISWSYDPKAVLLGYDNGTPLIKFTDPGSYWVEMTATFGACTYTVRKELEIAAYDPQAGPGYSLPVQVIDTVMLSPNPNNGNFNFRIKLNRKQKIVVYVYDMNGIIAGKKEYAQTLQVDDAFSVSGSTTGTFILRVITETESRDVRFIISR
ncbi:T9SS type A sorting domain-containing protein [Chitinophaga sp. CF418]|uniref:T9SS type A sorting domain-containing protein n=1 Tax=Chitinophaga sp. CF418 TaxID=1855287 RepID=UPI0009153E31|nr:T9SS type A sorting domain-containing protein [Chitinophaga sp. CF418]SHN44289.1 Por secretion system C-terminal sorting domain-containing protein [Chitinophaga sp. CF418]